MTSRALELAESIKWNNVQLQELLEDNTNPDAIAKAKNLSKVIAHRSNQLENVLAGKA